MDLPDFLIRFFFFFLILEHLKLSVANDNRVVGFFVVLKSTFIFCITKCVGLKKKRGFAKKTNVTKKEAEVRMKPEILSMV